MALTKKHDYFPFDLFAFTDLPGRLGSDIRVVAPYSMFPPFPWGQWLYGHLIARSVDRVAGHFIELGIGMGGMSLYLGLRAREHRRKMYSLDSFAGLPAPHPEFDNPVFREGDYGPPEGRALTQWHGRFQKKIDALELRDVVEVMPGFFDDTLAQLPEDARFAFAHVDCDLYTSVRPVLDALYDRVSEGGYVVIDDFFHPAQGALRATVDFFNARRSIPLFHVSFPYAVVVKKGERPGAGTGQFSVDGNLYTLDYLREDRVFVDTLEACWQRARSSEGGAEAAENARLLLSLLRAEDSGRRSDIYAYWYALREFWDGFQDPRQDRPVFTI